MSSTGRRDYWILYNMKFLFLFLLLLSYAQAAERTRVMMGTFATVSVPDESSACVERVFGAMDAVESALSSYRPDAEVYRLNHERSLAVSPILYDALLKAERYYVQSDGYFDITVGSLTKGAYRFGEAERIPGAQEKARAPIAFSKIDYDAEHVALAPGILVDFGGFGKGYGIDMATSALKRCGGRQGTIALSGDIRCLGQCLLAIQDPFSEGIIFKMRTKAYETGISTSGNYRRFVGDRDHSHLIDPKTKQSEKAFASVTLVGPAANSDLDAWTTAAAVMPPEKALRFLDGLPVGYVLVYNDGTIHKSTNLTAFVTIVEESDADH